MVGKPLQGMFSQETGRSPDKQSVGKGNKSPEIKTHTLRKDNTSTSDEGLTPGFEERDECHQLMVAAGGALVLDRITGEFGGSDAKKSCNLV